MNAYRKDFDETRYIWVIRTIRWNLGKIKNSLKKELDCEPVYNEKAKAKSYNGKINANFHDNKIPRESSKFTF